MSEFVFKINKASTTFHAIGYNEKKVAHGKAKCIHMANFGQLQFAKILPDKKEIEKYLEKYSAGNKRTAHKQFHAIMSCKGHAYTHEQLKEKALVVLEELGYKNQPTVMYAHSDTKNNHIHIVTTRINSKGQKINDSFEKIRSAKILSTLLQKEPEKEFQKDCKDCLAYTFTTEAQFRLLMEQRGYKISINKDDLAFVKYGTTQGSILKDDVKNHFTKETTDSRIRQVRAIISKYQSKYDCTLKLPDNYNENAKFQSDLTNYLKQNLGLEFVFFTTKEGKVHGYSIIDHAAKTVYKGSDVIRLNELTQTSQNEISTADRLDEKQPVVPATQASINEAAANQAITTDSRTIQAEQVPVEDQTEKNIPTNNYEHTQNSLFQEIIQESEKNNQQTATGRKPRRKRRDFI